MFNQGDIHGSRLGQEQNPITGSYFRLEKGPVATPPIYDYDEAGIVLEGKNEDVLPWTVFHNDWEQQVP